MRVFVYFNLHKKLFSVKALEGHNKGKVIAHLSSVCLKDAVCKVSQAGRKGVLEEKRKNIHAGVVGTLLDDTNTHIPNLCIKGITYNPYKYESFVYKENLMERSISEYAYMSVDNDIPSVFVSS